jgi:hypothetical protein
MFFLQAGNIICSQQAMWCLLLLAFQLAPRDFVVGYWKVHKTNDVGANYSRHLAIDDDCNFTSLEWKSRAGVRVVKKVRGRVFVSANRVLLRNTEVSTRIESVWGIGLGLGFGLGSSEDRGGCCGRFSIEALDEVAIHTNKQKFYTLQRYLPDDLLREEVSLREILVSTVVLNWLNQIK